MNEKTLSVIIPARNEIFLPNTIRDILKNIEGDTNIIAVLDGDWPKMDIIKDKRLTYIIHNEPKGQRASTNEAVKLSNAHYIMKVDAHCAFDKGFDVKMMNDMQEDYTMIPVMRNLHAFDWVCKNGHRRYQGISGVCKECGEPTEMDVVWIAKTNPQSTAYRLDKTMHFQYHNERKHTAEYKYGLIMGYRLSFNPQTVSFEIINFLTNFANAHGLACRGDDSWFRKNMTMNTMGFSTIDYSGSIRPEKILLISNKSQMSRVATSSILTQMINNGDVFTPTLWDTTNNPSIENPVYECFLPETGIASISAFVNPSDPIPASSSFINSDLINQLNNIIGGQFIYSEKTSSFHNKSVTLTPIRCQYLNETLSIQGSCFMLTRAKYWELDICSEEFHSWGQQGAEVAMKTWLSGGKVIVNRKTWYAHMFRTAGGDFSFPYEQPQSKVNENRELSRKLFQNDGWDKAKFKFQWLLDKFNPPEWESKPSKPSKGILYYTDNQLNIKLAKKCRKFIKESGFPITSVSLKPLTDFGHNIHFNGERSVLTMHKQILAGLKAMTEDIVFFTEHDCIYHNSHFDFIPEKKDVFYYNENNWRVRLDDGHAVYFAHDSLSQMCCYRELAIKEFENRVKRIEEKGFNHGGYEPGTRTIAKGGFSDNTSARWRSVEPNIDIRHDNNLTPSRWSTKEFRDKNTCKDWTESNIKNLWIKQI